MHPVILYILMLYRHIAVVSLNVCRKLSVGITQHCDNIGVIAFLQSWQW